MRVVISVDSDNGLDSVVSPHFGRCPYFVLVDMEGNKIESVRSVPNPYYSQHQPGQVPGFVHSQGGNVMLCGGMGRRAITFFEQYGIQPVTGAAGTVRRALDHYLGGQLGGAAPCRESMQHDHAEVPPEGEYEKDEVGRLREEAEMLQQQLDEAIKKLDSMANPDVN